MTTMLWHLGKCNYFIERFKMANTSMIETATMNMYICNSQALDLAKITIQKDEGISQHNIGK